MKKADNFNPAKWLVENKITFQSRLDEMEKFDATAYQEKNNFEPKQHGDKYNVQFEVAYVDGITSGNIMYKTFDVYANSEDEAKKKGELKLKDWSNTAFDSDPEFEMESYEFYGLENESEMDRDNY
jgi:3D (Asp-Asp-Asp) domain-containing protein